MEARGPRGAGAAGKVEAAPGPGPYSGARGGKGSVGGQGYVWVCVGDLVCERTSVSPLEEAEGVFQSMHLRPGGERWRYQLLLRPSEGPVVSTNHLSLLSLAVLSQLRTRFLILGAF